MRVLRDATKPLRSDGDLAYKGRRERWPKGCARFRRQKTKDGRFIVHRLLLGTPYGAAHDHVLPTLSPNGRFRLALTPLIPRLTAGEWGHENEAA
ncbi:MAG: hypothetical protein QXZ09_07185 [Candidatus Methanomethylicaceae archaeon]